MIYALEAYRVYETERYYCSTTSDPCAENDAAHKVDAVYFSLFFGFHARAKYEQLTSVDEVVF